MFFTHTFSKLLSSTGDRMSAIKNGYSWCSRASILENCTVLTLLAQRTPRVTLFCPIPNFIPDMASIWRCLWWILCFHNQVQWWLERVSKSKSFSNWLIANFNHTRHLHFLSRNASGNGSAITPLSSFYCKKASEWPAFGVKDNIVPPRRENVRVAVVSQYLLCCRCINTCDSETHWSRCGCGWEDRTVAIGWRWGPDWRLCRLPLRIQS